MNTTRRSITIRFDPDALELAQRHAECAEPALSLNTAVNMLIRAGAERVNPERLTELRTMTDLANLAEKLAQRLDMLDAD